MPQNLFPVVDAPVPKFRNHLFQCFGIFGRSILCAYRETVNDGSGDQVIFFHQLQLVGQNFGVFSCIGCFLPLLPESAKGGLRKQRDYSRAGTFDQQDFYYFCYYATLNGMIFKR